MRRYIKINIRPSNKIQMTIPNKRAGQIKFQNYSMKSSTPKYNWGSQSFAKLNDLPDGIIRNIMIFGTYKEAIALSCVSKQFVDLNETNELWKLFFHYEFHAFNSWTTRKFKDFKGRFMKIKKKKYLQRVGCSVASRNRVLERMFEEQWEDRARQYNLLEQVSHITFKLRQKDILICELGDLKYDKFHMKEYHKKIVARNKAKITTRKKIEKQIQKYTFKKLSRNQKLKNN